MSQDRPLSSLQSSQETISVSDLRDRLSTCNNVLKQANSTVYSNIVNNEIGCHKLHVCR